MKKLYTLNICITVIILSGISAWFIACQEKEEFVPLKIFSVDPPEPLIGDTVLITGEGFSPGIRYNRVFFPGANGAAVPFDNSTVTKLWVRVPEGAQPGQVTVNLFDEEVAASPVELAVKIPVIESVEPAEGMAGDTVAIKGQNFRPEQEGNTVRFNPKDAAHPNSLAKVLSGSSSSELRVVLPIDIRTGNVRILGFSGPEFKVLPPAITGIEPLEGVVGDTISILGRGFETGLSATIHFTGADATLMLANSTPRKLNVIVPRDAQDGTITVRYSTGETRELTSDQTFKVFPSITGIDPQVSIPRRTVTINGYGFSSIKENNIVKIGDVSATVTSASATQLKFTVPDDVQTGIVTVEVNQRMAVGPQFQVAAEGDPLIFRIDPRVGKVGSKVSIIGDYFSDNEADNKVYFHNNLLAEVLDATKTRLEVKIPEGATTGEVKVVVGDKTATWSGFEISDRLIPYITEIEPVIVPRGGTFTIKGGNFSEFKDDITISIQTSPGIFTPVKPLTATETLLTAKLPESITNAPAGEYRLSVRLYGNSSTSDVNIKIKGQPVIESLSSDAGTAGSVLVLTGKDFHNIESENAVTFGNTAAAVINPADADRNQVRVNVPGSLSPGVYEVKVTVFGVTSAAKTYTVKEPQVPFKNFYYAVQNTVAGTNTQKIMKVAFSAFPNQTPTEKMVYQFTGNALVRSMAVDLATNKTYFVGGNSTTAIYRTTATGNTKTLYSGQTNINDITLDPAAGKLYWSRPRTASASDIFKGDTIGGATPSSAFFISTPTQYMRGITYSPDDKRLYYCKMASSRMSLVSIRSDVAPPTETILINGTAEKTPVIADVKIDHKNGKIFMLCTNSFTASNTTLADRKSIFIADIDVANQTISGIDTLLFYSNPTVDDSRINGISLDIENKYVYFGKLENTKTAEQDQGIYRMRYDGNDIPGDQPGVKIEKVYTPSDVLVGGTGALPVFGGLVVEDAVNTQGASQRRRGSSLRGFSSGFSMEFNFEDKE